MCSRQEFDYSSNVLDDACRAPSPSAAGALRFGTQLIILKDASVGDLSKDAKKFSEALRHYHVIVLVAGGQVSSAANSAALTRAVKLGADGTPFLVVYPSDMAPQQDKAAPAAAPVEVAATAAGSRQTQREATVAEKTAQLVQLRLFAAMQQRVAALRRPGRVVTDAPPTLATTQPTPPHQSPRRVRPRRGPGARHAVGASACPPLCASQPASSTVGPLARRAPCHVAREVARVFKQGGRDPSHRDVTWHGQASLHGGALGAPRPMPRGARPSTARSPCPP
jgi:hypothetical protein